MASNRLHLYMVTSPTWTNNKILIISDLRTSSSSLEGVPICAWRTPPESGDQYTLNTKYVDSIQCTQISTALGEISQAVLYFVQTYCKQWVLETHLTHLNVSLHFWVKTLPNLYHRNLAILWRLLTLDVGSVNFLIPISGKEQFASSVIALMCTCLSDGKPKLGEP